MRLDPMRILLVEDDSDDHALTRNYLRETADATFELDWVQSCAEGLAALTRSSYDIILLDYHLGAETGLDFLGRLPLDEHTPVILLTGQTGREADSPVASRCR